MFFEALNMHRTLDFKSNPMDSSHFENNFKRTMNCPITRVNMNEPSTQRINWRCHCSVMYVIQQWSYIENSSFIVTYLTSQSNDSAIQNESKWNFSDASVERFYQISINRVMSPSDVVVLEAPL